MAEISTIVEEDIDEIHTELILKRLTLVCIAITAGISSAAILGWVLNWLILARISPAYIPMAQSTALSFIILSFALFVHTRKPTHPYAITFVRVSVFLTLILNFIIIIDLFIGAGFDLEQMLHPENLGVVPIGRMPPITAIDFVLSACALLLVLIFPDGRHRVRSVASFLAFIVVSSGLVMILGYLYGTPLLYGGTIPVALTTTVAFVFMGTGLIAATGQHYYPVRSFVGSSVQARLMRTLIPVTIIIILINGLVHNLLSPLTDNHVLLSSLSVILSVILVSIVVSKIVQIIGSNIDRVETERKLVEEALIDSEVKYHTLYDNSSDAIMMLDEKGFFDCNNATLQIFGYLKKEDFIKVHPADVSPPYQPDGADSYTASSNNIAQAFKKGTNHFE